MYRLRFKSPQLSLIPQTLFSFQSKSIPRSPNISRQFTSTSKESNPPPTSDEVKALVNEISELTLLELSDLTEVLRSKLGVKEMPVMAVMMPGMGFSGIKGAATAARGGAPAAKEKVEKTVFDVKLEGFEAAAKIKVIKEVRGFTDLGLKEAKELVEKAPTLLKKGVTKDEAEKIMAKLKEVGAKVSVE